MDRIDATASAVPPAPGAGAPPASEGRPSGSQRRVPAALYWILGAALVLRLVTAISDRGKASETEGLIHWQSAGNVHSISAATRRPILYDFTAAWCPPCRRLDSEGWADAGIATRIGSAFVPARIVDRQREDGKNPPAIEELHKRYGIQVFPTLVAADSSGREIARMEGYPGRERLEAFLREAVEKSKAAPGR